MLLSELMMHGIAIEDFNRNGLETESSRIIFDEVELELPVRSGWR